MPDSVLMVLSAPGIPVRGPSGSSAHFRGLARAFARRMDTRIVAAVEVDQRGEHGLLDVPVEAAPPPRFVTRRFPERREAHWADNVLEVALQGPRADLVYERWTLFSKVGRDLARTWGVPHVLEINAPLLDERLRFESVRDEKYARSWQERSLAGADRYVAVSPELVEWLVSMGVDRDRVRCVPNGTEALTGTRTEPDDFTIGFVGSMKPWHGADRVAEIAERAGGVPVLVGDPPVSEQELADAIASMDVALAPYAADAPEWFCPLKVAAYRAQGTPVVASDVGSMRRWVGEGGTVVPPTIDALAAACRAWRGRRAEPVLRSWDVVATEVLDGIGSRS
ncbi:MAG: glycosyltransferase family 4 protein [Proteobacteria bacterium]|nr:glycosyltransferase family 4 protein [Pseudomonadota bacterium]MCP4917560.1 glycosyltransferase family 4 protein [Pseudomonadota bacterium]